MRQQYDLGYLAALISVGPAGAEMSQNFMNVSQEPDTSRFSSDENDHIQPWNIIKWHAIHQLSEHNILCYNVNC